MGSFNGITFYTPRGRGGLTWQRQLVANETHIPGSDRNVLDIGGFAATRVSLAIFAPSGATWSALEALQGQSGTLVWVRGTNAAQLMSLTPSLYYPGGQIEGTAEWRLL